MAFSDWSVSIQLPEDILALIQWYRRVLEACLRRELLFSHATVSMNPFYPEGSWEPGGVVLKVSTCYTTPFHNTPPFELFAIDDTIVAVGMWSDFEQEIYFLGPTHIASTRVGERAFSPHSTIRAKRIRFGGVWVDCDLCCVVE
jgi:hypothetical protein